MRVCRLKGLIKTCAEHADVISKFIAYNFLCTGQQGFRQGVESLSLALGKLTITLHDQPD